MVRRGVCRLHRSCYLPHGLPCTFLMGSNGIFSCGNLRVNLFPAAAQDHKCCGRVGAWLPAGCSQNPLCIRRCCKAFAKPPHPVHKEPTQSISLDFPSPPEFILRYFCTTRLRTATELCREYALEKNTWPKVATRQQHRPNT